MFGAPTRFLIVDDMPEMRRILKIFLNSLGFQNVEQVAKGSDAVKRLLESAEYRLPIHIVILDWNLEDMKGTEVLEQIRNSDTIKSTKVLFVTAETGAKVADKAAALHVDGYLAKPLSQTSLKSALERLEKGLPPDWEAVRAL